MAEQVMNNDGLLMEISERLAIESAKRVEEAVVSLREQIAQEIEDKAKRYLVHWGEIVDYEERMQNGSWVDGSPINLSLDQFLVELVDVLDIVRGK